MPLPAAAKDLVEKKLDGFIAKRVPPHLADKIRLSYTFRGNSVTLREHRAPWTKSLPEWSRSAVAQLRYNPKAQTWMLYWRDRNSKWHKDERLAPVKNLDLIFAELGRDPTAFTGAKMGCPLPGTGTAGGSCSNSRWFLYLFSFVLYDRCSS